MSETVNTYSYPVTPELVTKLVIDTSSLSHSGRYEGSIDFAVPIDTLVLAAAEGIITRVRDDSEKYGENSKFGLDVNYITIEHLRGELSEYLHLAKNSALVKVGDRVDTGQAIAKTGLSGWMYAPHLHFMVYKKDDDFQCLDIAFGS